MYFYFVLNSHPTKIISRLQDSPTILADIYNNLTAIQSVQFLSFLHLGVIALSIPLYLLLPFDIIPESAFGILGLVDDIIIIFCILLLIVIRFRELTTRLQAERLHL